MFIYSGLCSSQWTPFPRCHWEDPHLWQPCSRWFLVTPDTLLWKPLPLSFILSPGAAGQPDTVDCSGEHKNGPSALKSFLCTGSAQIQTDTSEVTKSWVMASAWHTWTWKNKILHIWSHTVNYISWFILPQCTHRRTCPLWLLCTFKPPFLPLWAHGLCCLDAHSHPTLSVCLVGACSFFKAQPQSPLFILLSPTSVSLLQKCCFPLRCRLHITVTWLHITN